MSEVKFEKHGSMAALSGDVEKLTLSLDIDKLLDLQDKYTKLQCECQRLYEVIEDYANGIYRPMLKFENGFLSTIAASVQSNFRPYTEDERKAMMIELKQQLEQKKI